MTGLAQILARSRVLEPPALPSLERLRRSVRRVLERWPDVELPPERDRERIVAEMRAREAADNWRDLRISLVTSAARILFMADFRDRPDLARLRRFYVEETVASTRTGFLAAMAAVYLDTYEPAAAHSRELGSALAASKGRIGGRWRGLLDRVPVLFDPDCAHDALAASMSAMDEPWRELKEIGIRAPHGPGLMDAVHLGFVRGLGPRLGERPTIERLVGWLKPEGQPARVSGAAAALDALLVPWLQRNPGDLLQRYLTGAISGLYGHPRFGQHVAVWNETRSETRAVMLRWLTGANIRFFLDVVTEVEESHHWEPRRKFWLELYERKQILDASVAFCEQGEQVARRQASRGNGAGLDFGRQTAGGSWRHTNLLILDLGNCIVVEGSHDYKVHIFPKQHPNAPKLHQTRYDCEAIRHLRGAGAIPHLSGWEHRVVEAIQRRR